MDLNVFIYVATCWVYANGFNLEERLPLYKRGLAGSTFGFSVAMHKTKDGPTATLKDSLLVIGSPTASALPTQDDTKDPGGIFYCPVTTTPDECTRVQMDAGPSTANNNKTNQWLGVSLKSQGPGKYLITCAHRYTERFGTGRNEVEILCGKCFLLNGTNNNKLEELTQQSTGGIFIPSPCKNSPSYGKNTLAYTQAGVSAAWLGEEYLMGGPGAYAWSGAVFGYSMPEINPLGFTAEVTDEFETLGCADGELRPSRSGTKPKCDNIPLRRDSYMGFSVATSDSMKKDGSKGGTYIAGSPRGNFTGAVVLYRKEKDTSDMYDLVPEMQDVVMGEQIGSSFGFAVAATDINGDGLDDLLVGSPQYYSYSNEGKYGGALYVYLNHPDLPFSQTKPMIEYGPLDSFFGYSIAPLGDIDQDGFNDFAVGAPQDGSGKVHIYRGAADGFKKAQTLYGSNYTKLEPEMKGFGSSISGQVDIDDNKYPDMLIGTLKDQAILLRSRPVISVMATFKAIPSTIDLTKPNCRQNDKNETCFYIKYCLTYNARHMEYTEALNIKYTLTLDSKLPDNLRRVRFWTSPKNTTKTEEIILPRSNDTKCWSQKLYFSSTARNKLQPIAVDFKFSLVSEGKKITPEPPGARIFPMIDDPVLNQDYSNELTEIVKISSNCGNNGCQSNLQVGGSVPPEIVAGNTNKVILSLTVSNTGEEAHQAYVSVKLPQLVYYNSYSVVQPTTSDISCLTNEKGDFTFVECLLGNPYYTGSSDVIQIHLDVSFLTAATKNITFAVKGSTTSDNPVIPPLKLTTKVIVEMMLSLSGYGQPQQVRYSNGRILGSSAVVYTNEIGPLINHTYIIKNDGTQAAKDVVLQIDFPYEIKNGKWLLYLVMTGVMGGGGTVVGECTTTEVNPLSFKLSGERIIEAASAKRRKRDASASPLYEPKAVVTPFSTKFERKLILNCQDDKARCVTINCTIDSIQNGTTVSVFLQSRLWNATFLEEFKNVDLVQVETTAKLSNKQSNVRIVGNPTTKKIETIVDHAFFEEDAVNDFPWWYILIAIIIVLVIYIIIICCLIRCGFFKRKKYPKRERNDEATDELIEEKPKEDSL